MSLIIRYAGGNSERIPALVDELIAEKVDVMLLVRAAIPIAQQRAPTIPIVCAGMGDPVAEGIVASLARPGGNVTGLSWQSLDSIGKRVELAREVIPGLRQIVMIFAEDDRLSALDAKGVEEAARRVGLGATGFSFRDSASLEDALLAIQKLRPQLLFAISSPLAITHRKRLTSFAIKAHIPLLSEGRDWAEAGALLAFGPDGADIFRRAATYVDRILKGAKPSDLPIEQPLKFQLVLNRATAKAIGLEVPKSVLFRADAVIP
jgi:putative ABC transport system substrate-binding protein